jgi:hypothetical protein
MTNNRQSKLRSLQGRRVTLALRNGTRIDEAQLVSAGSGEAQYLWLFENRADRFVPLDEVRELWDEGFRPVL